MDRARATSMECAALLSSPAALEVRFDGHEAHTSTQPAPHHVPELHMLNTWYMR